MNTTIGCPIPGASQPKEPMRLIDIKEILQYDGAHFTWSGGRNCLTEQKAAYARGYDAGIKFIVDEAKKAPIIAPVTLRPAAEWISVGDRLPDFFDEVIVYDNCGFKSLVSTAWRRSGDNGGWIWDSRMSYPEELVNITHWMPLPKPPKEAHNE